MEKTEKQNKRYDIFCQRNGKEIIDNYIMNRWNITWDEVTKERASHVLSMLHSAFAWHGVKGVCGYKQYL